MYEYRIRHTLFEFIGNFCGGGFLVIGLALEIIGTSGYMTQVFLVAFQDATPTVMISALRLLIGTPVAVGIAQEPGAPGEPFILAILFRANLSFATPMSYKSNLLVMNAGNYMFNDFVKVGLPLTIILWLAYSFILSTLYL